MSSISANSDTSGAPGPAMGMPVSRNPSRTVAASLVRSTVLASAQATMLRHSLTSSWLRASDSSAIRDSSDAVETFDEGLVPSSMTGFFQRPPTL
ncbi:hypothetical protein [Nocardioides sp. J54]|uniref:hypothetical protein n=1 Tax=Nocardioides sp. J54 TaxID=935866 RepID=UPI00049024BF|nr:hypothetical protein [Nocardioides sp. J54]